MNRWDIIHPRRRFVALHLYLDSKLRSLTAQIVTSENDANSKFFWKSACYLCDKKKLVTLWKREDLHIPTRFTQIQRTLLLDAKVLKNLQMPKLSLDYLHFFTFFCLLSHQA